MQKHLMVLSHCNSVKSSEIKNFEKYRFRLCCIYKRAHLFDISITLAIIIKNPSNSTNNNNTKII